MLNKFLKLFLFLGIFLLITFKSVFAMDVSALSVFLVQEKSGYVCDDSSITCSSLSAVYKIEKDDSTTTYVCSGNATTCSSLNDLYRVEKSSGTYHICLGSSFSCSSFNDLYQIEEDGGDDYNVCSGDSFSCSSFNDLYQIEGSSSGDYNICSGDSITCSFLSDIYQVEKSGEDTFYICDGDSVTCSFLNNVYEFKSVNTSSYYDSAPDDYSQASLTCPSNSYLSGTMCYCNSGYKLNEANDACVKINCPANSSLVNGVCSCNAGYVSKNSICITHTDDCKLKYGENVYGTKNDIGSSSCFCNLGYAWNEGRTGCIAKIESICPVNGFSYNNSCYCESGYMFNSDKTECVKKPAVDAILTKKMKGKILLQVESKGEAWYINPKDGKRYYMADGNGAYNTMRNFGIGATNADLDKIKTNKTLAKKNSGKIFLQVESRGEAYYIDFNGNSHYLKDGAAAYEIMRSLGLGITNSNLNKISE